MQRLIVFKAEFSEAEGGIQRPAGGLGGAAAVTSFFAGAAAASQCIAGRHPARSKVFSHNFFAVPRSSPTPGCFFMRRGAQGKISAKPIAAVCAAKSSRQSRRTPAFQSVLSGDGFPYESNLTSKRSRSIIREKNRQGRWNGQGCIGCMQGSPGKTKKENKEQEGVDAG